MLSTNCYVVSNHETKEAIIIDPGLDYSSEAQQIFDYIEATGLKIKFIINTHGHPDHVRGNNILRERFRVLICIHPLDAYFIEGLEKEGFPAIAIISKKWRLNR